MNNFPQEYYFKNMENYDGSLTIRKNGNVYEWSMGYRFFEIPKYLYDALMKYHRADGKKLVLKKYQKNHI